MLTDEQRADGWIEHDGKGMPTEGDVAVRVMMRGGHLSKTPCWAGLFRHYKDQWHHDNGPFDIIAYRLETPDAQ